MVIVLAISGEDTRTQQEPQESCTSVKKALVFYRARTWKYQDELQIPRHKTTYPERWSRSCNYLRYSMGNWVSKSIEYRLILQSLNDPISAIYFVFGRYGNAAVKVAYCESGGTYSTTARNGQYLGMFQMSAWARRKYGHGNMALQQARAAYRYFVASGRDWSPWQCRP